MSEELKKIHLNTASVNKSGNGRSSKIVIFIVGGILGLILLAVALLGLTLMPLRSVMAQAKVVIQSVKETAQSFKGQDLAKTKEGLAKTRSNLDVLKKDYGKVTSLSVIPFLGAYIKDGQHAINAGFAGLDAGDKAIAALEPNADLLGFKGGGKFVLGSADERIQTAVKTLRALTPSVNSMAKNIDTLKNEIDAIDPKRYPLNIGKTRVRSQIESAKELIDTMAGLFVNAQPLITNLPAILGDPTDRRYLVIFQNDKELRSTGGFLTAFAQFRLVKGKIMLEKSDNIYSLDEAQQKKYPAPREILTFHKDVYQLYIRDSNLSPDFKQSMQQFYTMYNTTSGHEKIDGIFALDTHVLVEALKILGPSFLSGREFSAEIDKRCNCAKAIYELEDYSSRPVGYFRTQTERKGIIGDLMRDIMYKALGFSPSKYWSKLFQMMLSEISQKHILAYMLVPAEQQAMENFNLAGRIMSASETASLLKYKEGNGWDYLHINNSNMAGAKSNMFVNEKITKDTTVNSDGTLTTKLTIDYKNPFEGSDCNLEHGGLCLNGILRNWVRIFVPTGSKLVDSKGSVSPKDLKSNTLTTYDSLSKTVFEGFLTVSPLGTAKLELTYTSPVKINGSYKLLVQKQPGTDGQGIILKLNGRERINTLLNTDLEYSL
jgi:hypothetical protein